jgi:DNA modification methylase
MTRKETIAEGVELYLGDCRDVMGSFPPCFRVDAIVTDPPYGIGFKYESHIDDPATYHSFIWPIIETAEKHLVAGGPVFVWQAMPNVRNFHAWFPREWRMFCAAKNFVQVRPTAMQFAWDPVLVWWKEGEKPFRADNWGRDFFVADTASIVADKAQKFGHPCPRPIDHMDYVLERFVRPASTVLDPFMGSGTTGVAAVKLGRKFIGIEIEPKYFDIACKRISDALKQPDMFIKRPTPAKQEAFEL